jgi:serine protease Do
MNTLSRLIIVSLGSAVIGFTAAELVPSFAQQQPASPAPPLQQSIAPPAPPAPVAQPRSVPANRQEIELSFAPVVAEVTPSVVNVYATTITQASSPFAGDPFFQQFLGGGGLFQQRPQASQSLGSGVIVDPSGVILTNSHVVNGATDVRIALSDGHEYPVDVVLNDTQTDLAVLRVRNPGNTKFHAIRFGDSDSLQVGDLVLAIGNPFGVGQTVTSGIVSALARTGVESSNYESFIQTDAAINPGNSGGALVDLEGRLVGINTAIFSRSGGSVGIGFAIPANMARVVAQAGIAGGDLVRPWFGARMQDVTSDVAAGLGLDVARGALIAEVAPGGPADRAGLKSGDVITSVDGFNIQQPSNVDFRLATEGVGTAVKIGYLRNGQPGTVEMTLQAARDAHPTKIGGNTRFAGATVETLTAATAQDAGLPFDAKGVLIQSVAAGSPADDLGLQAGDLILSLNGRDMTDAETFSSVANARPRNWQIVLQRGGRVFQAMVSG